MILFGKVLHIIQYVHETTFEYFLFHDRDGKVVFILFQISNLNGALQEQNMCTPFKANALITTKNYTSINHIDSLLKL